MILQAHRGIDVLICLTLVRGAHALMRSEFQILANKAPENRRDAQASTNARPSFSEDSQASGCPRPAHEVS